MDLNNDCLLRHTKIVATLGPATANHDTLLAMVKSGMNMARLNFSHGDHAQHLAQIELVRAVMAELQCTIGIIADLQGPKIRIASFKTQKVSLKKGQAFFLDPTLMVDAGDEHGVGIHYPELVTDVSPHDVLLLDDGRLRIKVTHIEGTRIHTIVENDAMLSANKGINLLGGGLSAPALTNKDKEDLAFALKHNVDYVALSFVCNETDVHEAREIIEKAGSKACIISKIERAEALDVIESIIDASDAVMVARGDLAVEIGDARVPAVQKQLIDLSNKAHKPVITATQMMESMVNSVVPTRAEVSDVANAVLDGTDAVMLSEETAMGKHPALVIETMARACVGARCYLPDRVFMSLKETKPFTRTDEAIAMATIFTANHLDVKAILALTESGATPLWMSRRQSKKPIFALSRHQDTLGRMTLYRGVYPMYFDVTTCTRESLNQSAVQCLVDNNEVKDDDLVILTKGDARGECGGANAMKILVVGKVV